MSSIDILTYIHTIHISLTSLMLLSLVRLQECSSYILVTCADYVLVTLLGFQHVARVRTHQTR